MEDDYVGGYNNPLDSGRHTFVTGGNNNQSNFDRLLVD
jgi:hypothetical protein